MPAGTPADNPASTTYGEPDQVAPLPRPLPTGDAPTSPARESLIRLIRQGLDTSLRSVQVWAELSRALNAPPASPTHPAVINYVQQPIEALLAAQRHVVDQLVTTQQHLAQRLCVER